jgi:hypothetical protein
VQVLCKYPSFHTRLSKEGLGTKPPWVPATTVVINGADMGAAAMGVLEWQS